MAGLTKAAEEQVREIVRTEVTKALDMLADEISRLRSFDEISQRTLYNCLSNVAVLYRRSS